MASLSSDPVASVKELTRLRPWSGVWQTGLVAAAATWMAYQAGNLFCGHLRDDEIIGLFQAENAFYYSFYDQLVHSKDFVEGLWLLVSDRLSEAPSAINALKRFNIFQEVIIGAAWRGLSAAGLSTSPAFFYCSCVFAVHGVGLCALASCVPRGSYSGWCALIALALYMRLFQIASNVSYRPTLRECVSVPFWFATCASVQTLAARRATALSRSLAVHCDASSEASKALVADVAPATASTKRVLAPTSREAAAVGRITAAVHTLAPAARPEQTRNGESVVSIVQEWVPAFVSTVGFLLTWQFSCFALALQAAALGVASLIAGGFTFAVQLLGELCALQGVAVLLSCLLRFGDLWGVRSVFFAFCCGMVLARAVYLISLSRFVSSKWFAFVTGGVSGGSCFWVTRKLAIWLVVRWEGEIALNDDAHIQEFLAYRLGFLKGPLSLHPSLYVGQRSFSSPTLEDWRELYSGLALPLAVFAAALICIASARACFTVGGCRRQELCALFPYVFQLALAAVTMLLHCCMLRFRSLFVPHLVVVASLVFDARLCRPFWQHLGRFGTPFRVALLAMMVHGHIFQKRSTYADLLSAATEDPTELAEMMRWLRNNTAPQDVMIANMGISALIRLHAKRGIVCHPHYESAALRDRCFWTEKMAGHRTFDEFLPILHNKILPQGVPGNAFLVVGARSCFSKLENGQVLSELIEQAEPWRVERLPQMCMELHAFASKARRIKSTDAFLPRFVGRWFAVLEVRASTRSSVSWKPTPRMTCNAAIFLLEERDMESVAIKAFKSVAGVSLDELGPDCACTGMKYWPAGTVQRGRVHELALHHHGTGSTGSIGCCKLYPTKSLVPCLQRASHELEREGELGSAGAYQKHTLLFLPNSSKSHGFYGFTLLKQGRFRESLEYLHYAISLEGEEPTVTSRCGEAINYLALGDFDAVAESLRIASGLQGVDQGVEVCVKVSPGLHIGLGADVFAGYRPLQDALEAYDGGVRGWRSFLETEAARDHLKRKFRGTRLLFLGDPLKHLPAILDQLKVLRDVHGCDWPAEYWVEGFESSRLQKRDLEKLSSFGAELRVLPSPVGEWRRVFWSWLPKFRRRWNERFPSSMRLQKYALKPLILLLSDCEECLFMDADNLALQSPEVLLPSLRETNALFWPDLWDSPTAGPLWSSLPEPPAAGDKSHESGQLLVAKRHTKVVAALLLAVLLAVRADVFLEALYKLDQGDSLMCGFGDKDVFRAAFSLVGAQFRLVTKIPSIILAHGGHFHGQLQLFGKEGDSKARPMFLHAAGSKHPMAQILQDPSLQRCDFRSLAQAQNLSCLASAGQGSVNVPLKDMKCKPLRFKALDALIVSLHGELL
eukprot:TRINITY_DN49756_c0_g1_i1.p1 TRINITY_DN49756_c0_g1~~TRINITY_DN49756_c0_g1_i1.p1  ORF type:complete len:1365 (-),score=166.52 TRINITY_DN49756_c0_g1_i1:14-4072(-)